MCWRTPSKNENVRWLFSLASGSQTVMKEPLWPVAFAPPPAPSPTASAPLGRGRKNKGFLQAGVARLQKTTIFFSPPQRRILRWGGGWGRGKSYRLQRSIHRRLATWRRAERLPAPYSFCD